MTAVAKHASGYESTLLVDSAGGLVLAAANPNANVRNLTAAGTTTLKTGAGVLTSFTVNTGIASGTATFWNNTAASGTKLGTFACVNQGSYQLNWPFTIGLTVVIVNASDTTTVYI